jgi:hypothetical protein
MALTNLSALAWIVVFAAIAGGVVLASSVLVWVARLQRENECDRQQGKR